MLVIDSQIAGISGDMLLSSLIDIGANKNRVINALLSYQNFHEGSKIVDLSFLEVKRSGFRATALNLQIDDDLHERKGVDVYDSIAQCCDSLDLENKAKAFALGSIRTLIETEANVHGEEYGNVHLHEASSIDTLVDIVGTAVAIQDLGLFNTEIYSSRVAVGGGVLTFSHGTITNPGSAILEIFKNRNFTLIGGPVDSEITTPTGASMLVNLAKGSLDYYPAFQPSRVGYGAGRKDFTEFPNLLKIVLGKEVQKMQMDIIHVLETNVDDATGEMIGNIIDTLVEKGVKDVSVIPTTTKKNRPGYIIRVICENEFVNSVLNALVEESGTLGVRVHQTSRYVRPRIILTIPVRIKGEEFNIRVKTVKEQNRVVYAKPEYEDVKSVSMKLGIPFPLASTMIQHSIMDKLAVNQS